MARNKADVRNPAEDPRYHDTWKLLKRYRDVVWSLELSVLQVKNQFRIEYDSSIEDFLETIYMAGADLHGTDIESHARCIERSHKMLALLENAIMLDKQMRLRIGNQYQFYFTPSAASGMDRLPTILQPQDLLLGIEDLGEYRAEQESPNFQIYDQSTFGKE